MRSHSNK